MPSTENTNITRIGNSMGKRKTFDVSRQTPDKDAFNNSSNSIAVISTPYSLATLTKTIQQSSIVRQCIDAMIANTASSGYTIVPVDPSKTLEEADQTEVATLASYIQYANPNQTLTELQELLKSDYESYGYSFREIIRSRNGKVSGLRHAPAYNIRILSDSAGYIEVSKTILRGGTRTTVRELRLFKKYVQELSSVDSTNIAKHSLSKGSGRVYFKEFGDPRRMDYRTGRYETEASKVEGEYLATEILHEKQISPDAYGIPRWVAALPAILGAREAEEVNMNYFVDNTIPPALLTVSGGRLTQKSFQELDDLLTRGGFGKERQHKMVLIEAIPESNGLEDSGNVTINVEKLADSRQSDALFAEYEKSAAEKVQTLFRIPPALLGISGSNFANSNASIHIAEVQVFEPDRRRHDTFWNINLVNHQDGLGLKTVKLQSKSMSVTESSEVVKALATLNVSGAITGRTAVELARDMLGFDMPKYPEKGQDGYEEWMDMPLAMATRKTTENLPETGSRESESSPEAKITVQEETGETPPPEHGSE